MVVIGGGADEEEEEEEEEEEAELRAAILRSRWMDRSIAKRTFDRGAAEIQSSRSGFSGGESATLAVFG